jgi:hypothetical protein
VQNFFGNPNGNGTVELLEGADTDIHSSFLSLLCGVEKCPYFSPEQRPCRGAGSEIQSWA